VSDEIRIPSVRVDPDGRFLSWDPYGDLEQWPVVRLSISRTTPLDEFAMLARPWEDDERLIRIRQLADRFGPLTYCRCFRSHALRWRMEPPNPRRPPESREMVGYWLRASEHVNAVRRLISTLGVGPGSADDWSIVWPDRPGGIGRGADPDLGEQDGLERATAPWGDVAWERLQIAQHLESWVGSFHGSIVAWDADDVRRRVPYPGSLLGALGELLLEELANRGRIRVCTGSVRSHPCRVTWSLVRVKPRVTSRPDLCDPCYAAWRQARKERMR
jgi:hypothetical protein